MIENMATRLQSQALTKAGIEHSSVKQIKPQLFKVYGIRNDQNVDVRELIEDVWQTQIILWTLGEKPHLLDVTYGA